MKVITENLSSGKMIARFYDELTGRMEREVHRYGMDIAFLRSQSVDGEVSETYMVRGKTVDARKYAMHAKGFPDMPLPNTSNDALAAAAQVLSVEHSRWLAQYDAHVAVPDRGRRLDVLCSDMMENALAGEGRSWLDRRDFVLGTLSGADSRKLMRKLYKAGAMTLRLVGEFRCQHQMHCIGEIVVELPEDPKARKALLAECDRVARMRGEHGVYDDRQRFVLIRL